MASVAVTELQIDAAYAHGQNYARNGESDEPVDDIWEHVDQRDLVFDVTGYKLDLDVDEEEAQELLDAFSDGYYDWFDL